VRARCRHRKINESEGPVLEHEAVDADTSCIRGTRA
jgi:hypothetical protein